MEPKGDGVEGIFSTKVDWGWWVQMLPKSKGNKGQKEGASP